MHLKGTEGMANSTDTGSSLIMVCTVFSNKLNFYGNTLNNMLGYVIYFQPLFTVSGQQNSIRAFSEGEYKGLRGKFDKNGVSEIYFCLLNICIVVCCSILVVLKYLLCPVRSITWTW